MHDYWTLMKKLIWLKILQGASFVVNKITGTSPITLTNAINSTIISLKQYGKCVQDGTPTPDAPVDIVCNNGALKMVHRSGLPSGYKLLEYVGGNGSRNVLTDVYLASTDVVECEFKNSTTTGYGAMYGVFKLGESSALYANQTYYGYDADNNKVDTGIRVDTEWHSSRHDFVNGTLTIDDTTVTFAPFEFENSVKNAVLSRYYNNNYGYSWKGYVRKFKVTRNGEVVCDLLPAKNSNDVAGLYDLVTGIFYEGMGGDLLEGNEVDDYELSVVGTPEVLTVSADGAETQTVTDIPMLLSVGDYADEAEIISGLLTHRVGIKVLDGTEEIWGTTSQTPGYTTILTNCYTVAIPLGNAPIYKRRVYCTHLNSSDALPAADKRQGYALLGNGGAGTPAPLLNKYAIGLGLTARFPTIAGLKQWLAEQYAAGTPVIVIYPLAEETTEQTAPQPLTTTKGTNTVTVTSNIDLVTLEVEYKENR